MFETIEIRKVANGFILVVTTEEDTQEFIYDTPRKLMSAVKKQLGDRTPE
jgi:hypothetical protein